MRRLLIGLIAVVMFSLWVAASPTGFESRLNTRIPADGSITVTKFERTLGDTTPVLTRLTILPTDTTGMLWNGYQLNRGQLSVIASNEVSGIAPSYGLDIRCDNRWDKVPARLINIVAEGVKANHDVTAIRCVLQPATKDSMRSVTGLYMYTSSEVDSASLLELRSNYAGSAVTNIFSICSDGAYNFYGTGGVFYFDGDYVDFAADQSINFYGKAGFDSTLHLTEPNIRGKATLDAATDSVWISTPLAAAITPFKAFYILTPYNLSGDLTMNGTLYVRKVSVGSGFAVKSTADETADIPFMWMIIRVD